jgi:hypothetical protein
MGPLYGGREEFYVVPTRVRLQSSNKEKVRQVVS